MEWLLPGAFGVSLVAFFVSTIGLVIWTLVDSCGAGRPSVKAGTQLVWVMADMLVGLIGAIIYLAVGMLPGGATAARQWLPVGMTPPPPPPRGAL